MNPDTRSAGQVSAWIYQQLQKERDELLIGIAALEQKLAAYEEAEKIVVNDDAVQVALLFHNLYEMLAPKFGYETRKDTKGFDAESPNGKLMVAVCGQITSKLRTIATAALADKAGLEQRLAEVRAATIEECAKVVCKYCAAGNPSNGSWHYLAITDQHVPCNGAPIRALTAAANADSDGRAGQHSKEPS